MRILLVGDHPPPHGGISVHVAGLAAALRDASCDVRVLDVARPAKASPPSGVVPARDPLHVAGTIVGWARRGYLVHVHVSGHNAPSWWLAAASTWLSRPFGPSVVTVHSGLAPAHLARASARWRARLACTPASRVLCANEDIQRALRRCDVRPGRLEVLPAFVHAHGPLPPPPAAFAALRRSCSVVLVAALGHGPEYGRSLLVETIAQLAHARSDLGVCTIGAGADGELRQRLGALLGERALSLGEIDHREALAVFAEADVLLRPTLADGDSVCVREALSLGARVVATSVAPRPEGVRVAAPLPAELAAATLRAFEAGRSDRPRALLSAHRRLLEIYAALLAPELRLVPAHGAP